MIRTNQRLTTLWFLIAAVLILAAVTLSGILLEERAMETDFAQKDLAPSLLFPFGTDWMGRNMLARTLAGLSLSIRIGLLTALVSAGAAIVLGILSASFGGWVDAVISWWIDLVMGIPHILLAVSYTHLSRHRPLFGVLGSHEGGAGSLYQPVYPGKVPKVSAVYWSGSMAPGHH